MSEKKTVRLGKTKYRVVKNYLDDDPDKPVFNIVKLTDGEALIIELLESIGAKL